MRLTIDNDASMRLTVDADASAKLSTSITVIDGQTYPGPYAVTPELQEVILGTKGYVMKDDVEVEAIPVLKISNDAGGYTVTIGD